MTGRGEKLSEVPDLDAMAKADQCMENAVKQSFAKKINEVSRRAARKERVRAPIDPDERVDVDRTALNAILDVGSRQKKTTGSLSTSVLRK